MVENLKFAVSILFGFMGVKVEVVKAVYLESRRSRVSSRAQTFRFQRNKIFLPRSLVKIFIDGEVAFLCWDHQGSNFESCVRRAVSSYSSHHPQVHLYVNKCRVKPGHSFIFTVPLACLIACPSVRLFVRSVVCSSDR